MARLKLIEYDGEYESFEINTSDLSGDAISKIRHAVTKKDGKCVDGGLTFGTGVFPNTLVVYLRKPVKTDNPTKAYREVVALTKKILTQALNYVDQENTVHRNGVCEEASSILRDCLNELK